MNIRVSVTDIDAYIYFRDHDNGDFDKLMCQLRKEEPQTEPMRAGSAFHKAMEMAQPGDMVALEADGYYFAISPNVEMTLPRFRELKLECQMDSGIRSNLTVTLVGKVDGLDYNVVHDHKTTSRFVPDTLLDSYQWRFYLLASGADVFQWNVFEIKATGDREYEAFDFHVLRQYRYPGLAEDCKRMLCEFLTFLDVGSMTTPEEEHCTLADLLRMNRPTMPVTIGEMWATGGLDEQMSHS